MHGSPNALAYLMLGAALPLGVALFFALRPAVAALVVFLGTLMFLPEQVMFDLPGLPGIGKEQIASIACVIGIALRARSKLWRAKPLRGPEFLVVLMLFSNLGTALTNRDPIVHTYFGGVINLPALSAYEGVSMAISDTLYYLLPFLIARTLFTEERDLKVLLSGLAVAAAIYTPFLFIELMMSPQMHRWTYGFHQHDFNQTIRGGGFRPMVYMTHGLMVGLFMCWGSIAALTLAKARKRAGPVPGPALTVYDVGWLISVKSLGAVIYTFVCAPMLLLLKPRMIARICAVLALIVMTYPITRATSIFPEQGLVDVARSISADRAQSLEYRFNMERLLTEHTKERPLFGWGRYRRNMVYGEWDDQPVSVSDGHWIVVYSIRGAVGFVLIFSLLLWPVWKLRKRLRLIEDPKVKIMLAGLGLIVVVAGIDLIPNGLHNSITVFLAGALWGLQKGLSKPEMLEETPR